MTAELQLKLDELLRASAEARNQLISLESFDDKQLDVLEQEFKRIREHRGGAVG